VLRLLLAALIAANLIYFEYNLGAFDGVLGLPSHDSNREPERLTAQIRPESVRVLPMSAASAPTPAQAQAQAAGSCYETPTFTAADAIAVETALAGNLPAGTWSDSRGERNLGTRTEVTHTYRVVAPDPTLAARLPTLKLDAAGRGFSFSPCARVDNKPG
jgi:hypothetical protein